MARNRILLLFRLIVSAINVAENKNQYATIMEYLKEITSVNQQRSLVLVYSNQSVFEEFSHNFYSLSLPLYNIYLPEVKKFNGKYHDKYDIAVTFEESKLYFLTINKLEDIYEDLILTRKVYFWKDRDKLLIFVKQQTHENVVLKPIFEFCFKYFVVNIVLVFQTDEVISFFTYNPFKDQYALPLQDLENLFQDKFQDLYGYQLKISMFPDVTNVYKFGTYQGRDGIMSRAITDHLNASYVYILPKKNNLAPVLNQYDEVAERMADVGFNTRYIKFNFKNLIEKTYPHDRDGLVCMIPKKQMQKFNGLTSLLPELVWWLTLCVSLLFFAYTFISMLIEGHRLDPIDLSMKILLLLVNKPIKEIKIFNFRLVLMTYLFLCFFLNTLLICRLTSIFTAPEHYHDIDTVRELAESNYEILTIDRFEELLNASLILNVREKILQKLTIIKEEQYLGEMRKCKNVVFVCKEHLANYAEIQDENYPNGVKFYRIMEETILPALSCYIVSYGSPFLPRLDTLIRRVLEAGLNDYWMIRTWQALGGVYNIRQDRKRYSNFASLSISDFLIGIQVILIGNGIAMLIFLTELFFKKIIKF